MTFKTELRGMATAGLLLFCVALLLIVAPIALPGIELLQSLRFHLAALGVPLALVLMLAGGRWRALLTIAVMSASIGHSLLPVLDGYARRDAVGGDSLGTITVLSFNVLHSNQTGRDAADFIIAEAPDIAVIMETPGVGPYLDDIARVLPYRLGCDMARGCDLSIFSRTPLVEAEMFQMPPFGRNRLGLVSTVIDGVTVNVAGIHLSKPYFDEAAWMELQSAQRVLRDIEGPLIVAGDFNAAAWSDELISFSDDLGLVPPPSHPGTWPVRAGALGVPIDNMFTRGQVLIDSIAAPNDSHGSNHRALLARLSLRTLLAQSL